MEQNDARSQLIWRFLDAVELLRPRAFVMENVKALAVLKKWEPIRRRYMERVSKLGYFCGDWVLNAADYGVPQSEERGFFVGSAAPMDAAVFEISLQRKNAGPVRCGIFFRACRRSALLEIRTPALRALRLRLRLSCGKALMPA